MEVHLVAIGSAGPIALHAAALEPRIKSVTLDRCILSWSDVVHTPISHNQLANVVPGALRYYDLPDLAALLAPRALTIKNPIDPAGKPVSREVLEQRYAKCRSAYRQAGAEGNLVLEAAK
jgi:hypothetical protein